MVQFRYREKKAEVKRQNPYWVQGRALRRPKGWRERVPQRFRVARKRDRHPSPRAIKGTDK